MRWLLIFFALPLFATLEVELEAPMAILINADTGKILYEKEARVRHYPASTTKIATAKFVFEMACDRLDEVIQAERDALVTVLPPVKRADNWAAPSHWNETDGTHIGIVAGERMPLSMLLAGLMLESGNDAANVIGQHLAGTPADFVDRLNRRFEELGLRETHFTNPHGLHHPDHVTTAYEMAQLARWAWSEPRLREMVGEREIAHPATNRRGEGWFVQKNQLVRSGRHHYPRAVGFKTGYHAAAGYNLVAVATEAGRTLIAVVFGCRESSQRFIDARNLFDAAFSEEPLLRHIPVSERRFRRERLCAAPGGDFDLTIYPSEDGPIHLVTVWEAPERVRKGERVGELRATTEGGAVLAAVPLVATRSVGRGFGDLRLWLIGGGALLLVYFVRPRGNSHR